MQVALRFRSFRQGATRGLRVAVCCGVVFGSMPAFAWESPAATPVGDIDLHLMADLEQRASTANPRDQAFLYADLVDKMTVLVARQIADGQIENAEQTLEKMETFTAKMENGLQQSKSLKKTELLLHTTNRRLSDIARAASYDVKPHVQEALKRLNTAQTSLLAVIFAK